MPYKSTEDLPENVQHVLPAHAHDRESRRFPPSSDRASVLPLKLMYGLILGIFCDPLKLN